MRVAYPLLAIVAMAVGSWGFQLTASGATLPQAPSAALPTTGHREVNASAPLSLEDRADIMMARKRFEEARDLFDSAIEKNPDDAALHNKIGIAYQQLLQRKDAEKAYKRAIKLDAKFADPYNNLGTIYYENRNYKKAIKFYNLAIDRRQNVACFYVNRGTAEFMRNHIDKARNDYQRALQLDPTALDPSSTAGTLVEDRSVTDPARFHFLLAKLYCSVGRLDDAMHQFRQALEQHYPHWKDVFKDDTFKPLRARRDFQLLMSQPTQS